MSGDQAILSQINDIPNSSNAQRLKSLLSIPAQKTSSFILQGQGIQFVGQCAGSSCTSNNNYCITDADCGGGGNNAPTDITLTPASVNQSGGFNAVVGTLSSSDADNGDSHTYTLVSGQGSTDNGSFNISGSSLRANDASVMTAGSYSVRINTNDGSADYSKKLIITVEDDVSPTISSVSVPVNGTYTAGENLDFTVNFDENITVNTGGGTPRLELTIGSTTHYATYVSGSGTSALVFSYTVQSGDSDTNGIVLSATLDTNGGTLQDSAGNSANTTLNSVGSLTSVLVDTTVPTVSNVSSTKADGSYKEGDVVAITVTFSEAVTVTGTPQLTLETGDSNRTVNYTSGSGTDTLIFNYTVQAGDTSADLDYASITALTLNGGSIQDSAGNDATLTLVAPGSTGSLAANKALVIDTAVPVFDTVSVTDTDIFYKAGETITFGVNLGETGLTVTANLSVLDSDFGPDVALADDGDGSYSLTTSALNTSGNMLEGTIAVTFTASDSAGNQASNSSLSLNLDKTAPTFDSNNSTPNDNATGVTVGDNIVIDFSEAVTLLSSQIITLADVTNGVIVETFTAASGNNGGTISVSSDKVTLNPGTDLLAGTEYAVQVSASAIQDLAGNSFAGISDNTTFSFRTAATLALSASATEMPEKGGSVTYTVSLQDGKGNPFTASENIVAAIQFGGTATKDTDYSVTGLSSSDDITIASGSSSATLSVTATDDAEEDDAETIVVALNSVSSGTATISSGSSASVTINENNPPVFSNLDAAPAYTEDGSAVIIDGDAMVSDTELDALNGGNGNYDGATLTIARSGGASGNDLFANNGLLGALNEGEDLVYNGTTIGTVTSNSNGTLILTFNSSATTALVNSVLQNITYANSANEPAGSVVLSFTFNDGTENSSGTNQVTANITASNDAPTLTATGANPTFTEGGSAATVFSSANVSTVESGQTLSGLVLMVTNVSDSGSEVLTVDGTAITLASDVNGTTTANGLSYTVAVAGTTATLTFTGGSLTEADLQTLIDAISYQNNSQDPTTDSNRVVTITSLTDSGSENATTSLSIASMVTLTAVNDEPTLTATAVNPTFTENGDAAVVFSSATASTVETGQTLSGLVLTVNNVTDSGSEVLTVDGTAIMLDDAASGTTATNSLSYAVTVASDTVTVYFTSGSLSNEALQTLVDGINYQNSSDDPAIENARVVTISSLTDSGSGSGDNDNTNDTLSIASKVTLSAVNDVPMVTGLVSGFSATEDVAANLDVSGITVSDAEGDTISIVLTVNSGVLTAANGDGSINGVTVSGSGTASVILSGSVADINIWLDTANMLSFTSSSNTNGNVTLTVTPSDAEAGSAVSSSVNVTAVNDAPVISGTPATSVAEDSAYSFIPSGSDVDTGDSLTYSIANKPNWADFSASTGALTGTPDNYDVGSYNDIRITVADSGNATDTLTPFSISVTNVNDAPTISGTPATKALQGSAYSFTPVGNDVDAGDSLTYSINKTPDWASFDLATGTLSGTPTNDDVGSTTNNIVISVSDGEETVALNAFDLEVENINDAPVISGTPATTVAEDTAYSFTPDSNDIDADTLTFSIENKPGWASFDTATGALTGTPDNDNVGITSDIVISVSDGKATTALTAFAVEVTNTNDAPVAVNDNSYAFAASDSGSYTLDVLANDTDVDKDTLQLAWVSTDSGSASIQGASVVLETDLVGTVNLKYGISDGNGGTATGLATVVITSNSVQAPTITSPENVEVKANALFTKVDLGVAVAQNSSGEPLPVSLVDHSTFFAPGQHTVYWRTQDAKGNEARASQQVTVHPLVSISKDDVTTEGTNHTVKVFLNGEAPSYPVVIPYTVSGSSDSADHNLVSGNVIISSATEGSIEFSVNADEVAEGTETVEITLDDSLNLGSKSHYVLSVYEENVAPEVSIMVSQSGESRPLVENSAVAVTVTATVTDANAGDTHSYNWLNDNAHLANISQSYNQFIFSPEGLTPGIYQLKLEVTDSASAMVTTDIYIEVVAQLATLDGQDSDGDLIPDNQEGFTDSDNDGISDYQDAISECNVIQEQALESQSYLVEGEPGVCLCKGVTLASNQTGGAQLMTHELTHDTQAENIGGIFDFVAYGLPTAGQTYQVVFPQRLPIPANAVYRKYKESSGWVDFQTDANNYVSSTKGEEGYCPPPGDRAWSQGLTEGHWCVQLTIQDGGPNDDDGMANGSIVDPGGVATTSKNTLPVAVNDNVYVAINGSLQIDVLGNDSDADNDSLIITSASANFGTVSIENGMIAYRAADKFYGTDTISYSVTDGNGGTAYAGVTVNVTQSAGGVVKNSAGGGSMGGLAVFTLGLLGAFRRHGRKVTATLLALLSFSSQANWYLDADLGVSKADARLPVADSQLQDTDKRDTAWSLGLGYRINPD
ncbi:Ig-like domain-containing protein [Vibrio diabolicus]|uniref:Ig-like domain-containing protein n=1 Tax=Vibrio diabolicus TaxID=50719 RepID=UPI00232B4C87|nr:Ig-like domain-containing protein [Vibrio diabolicus]